MQYKAILYPIDGSKQSLQSLDHVASLAKMYDAQVFVLQVVDAVAQVITAINTANATFEAQEIISDIAKKEKKLAKQNVIKIKTQLESSGVSNCETLIHEGDARDEIIRVAKEKSVDLIIMSTHGRSGLKRAFLGSVAEDVVRHAPCPVLLVRSKQK